MGVWAVAGWTGSHRSNTSMGSRSGLVPPEQKAPYSGKALYANRHGDLHYGQALKSGVASGAFINFFSG